MGEEQPAERTIGDLTEEEREALYTSQTTEQYAAIGRFVVEFENACGSIRSMMMRLLQMGGLKSQPLGNILLDSKSMTASPLIYAYEAMLRECGLMAVPTQEEVFNQLCKEFRDLMEVRNNYVHAHWFIGFSNPANKDFSRFGALKGSPSKKKGMAYVDMPKNVDEIIGMADQAKELACFLREVEAAITLQVIEPGKGKFENNFSKVDGKWTRQRPQKT